MLEFVVGNMIFCIGDTTISSMNISLCISMISIWPRWKLFKWLSGYFYLFSCSWVESNFIIVFVIRSQYPMYSSVLQGYSKWLGRNRVVIGGFNDCFSKMTAARMEQTGVKMVVELVRAFNELTRWMSVLISTASQLLFKALKLSIPLPQAFPLTPDGHSSLSKGLDSCSSSRRPSGTPAFYILNLQNFMFSITYLWVFSEFDCRWMLK